MPSVKVQAIEFFIMLNEELFTKNKYKIIKSRLNYLSTLNKSKYKNSIVVSQLHQFD